MSSVLLWSLGGRVLVARPEETGWRCIFRSHAKILSACFIEKAQVTVVLPDTVEDADIRAQEDRPLLQSSLHCVYHFVHT